MSVFTADGTTYDDKGVWLRHTTTSEIGRIDGDIVILFIDGVPHFQTRENNVLKDTQLLPMVGENLVYDNDLGHVLDNDLNPVYINEF